MNLPPTITSLALIANGFIENYALLSPYIRRYPYLVAVDGGLAHCQAMNLRPDILVGDLDSVTEAQLSRVVDIPIHRLHPDKDETDLEVAVQLFEQPQIREMTIFGGLRKRTDHCLGNLHLLRRYPGKLRIESETETIFCVHGTYTIPSVVGQVISLIPLGTPARGVSTQGLRWELKQATLDSHFLSVSNEATGPSIQISVLEGDLLCIIQRISEET